MVVNIDIDRCQLHIVVSCAVTPRRLMTAAFRVVQSRTMRWGGGHVAGRREKRNTHRFLMGKPGGNITSERLRSKWQYSIKMDVRRTGWTE